MKANVFIGSSTRGIPVAETIQQALKHDANATVWNQGVFRTKNVPIEDLMRALDEYDFAVFVFLPEDTINIRDEEMMVVRDNVLFELGLFLGELGRDRNFIIAPEAELPNLRLPSDLAGIRPAPYDGSAKNRHSAVAAALYELKQSIRELGPRTQHGPKEVLLYNGKPEAFRDFHFTGWNGCFWKDDAAASPRSEGNLDVLSDSILRVERRTVEGRFEVTLRPHGKDKPSILRKLDVPDRVIRLTCDIKAEGAHHTLHFVLKDEREDRWVADQVRKVPAGDWSSVSLHFRVPASSDVLLRIDDEVPSAAPTSLYLKNLVLVEEEN